MRNFQKIGGIAALIAAATNLLGMVVFVTLLVPKGLDFTNSDPGRIVALLADNQAAMRLWYEKNGPQAAPPGPGAADEMVEGRGAIRSATPGA